MNKKNIVITGCTIGGIGFEAAKSLSEAGHRLIITTRSQERSRAAAEKIGAEPYVLDLSDRESIKLFTGTIKKNVDHIDILINNAGYLSTRPCETADGREMTMAVNYEGTKDLTERLLSLMAESGQIINISSAVAAYGRMDRLGKSSGFRAYCDSKLALNLYTRELAARLESSQISVNAVHPGMIITNIWKNLWPGLKWLEGLIDLIDRTGLISSNKGKGSILFLVLAREEERGTDGYYSRSRLAPWPANCR